MDESVIKHLEQQQITKLSQAIRIGAKLRPQGFSPNCFWEYGHSCAAMAAQEALTGKIDSLPLTWLETQLNVPNYVTRDIWKWNDVKRLTREEIADKLEALGY